ncbi:MAG: late competence development ComFB family protein [Clostridiales bacterium]|nr:late competence development ComFB family protein [Clostridiales bacterium]
MPEGKERPINLVKQIAEDLLPSVMKKLEVEDTEDNRVDILALALNNLPTKYVTSSGGRLYAEMINNFKVQYQADILAGLTKAAMKVKDSPRRNDARGEG